MKRYTVEIRETGDALADFATREEAEAYIRQQEARDADEGAYEEGCYAIRDEETDECLPEHGHEPDASEIAMVMSALGRRKSAAKAAASRENGKKGGRPRKKPAEAR